MDKYLIYNDVQCHYTDNGSGAVILFTHGFAEDGTVWSHFQQAFTGYRCLVPDFPGVGKSAVYDKEYSVEMLADYLLAVLRDAGVDKVHLVGHSMGGYASLAFAEKHGEMLLSLTMFHSQAHADDDEKKAGRLKQADFIAKRGTSLFVKELYYKLFAEEFAKNNATFIDARIATVAQFPAITLQQQLKAMANRPDRTVVLKNIKVPVLFIIGKEDTAIPHENSMKQTHLADWSEVHLLDGVAHMGMFEKEEECQKILGGFLAAAIR